MIPAMLDGIGADDGYETIYELPPVDPEVQVGTCGPVERLRSTALRGRVLTDSRDIASAAGRRSRSPQRGARRPLPGDPARLGGPSHRPGPYRGRG